MWIVSVIKYNYPSEWFETFTDEELAKKKYLEYLEEYKEEIAKKEVDVYFSNVIKSTEN